MITMIMITFIVITIIVITIIVMTLTMLTFTVLAVLQAGGAGPTAGQLYLHRQGLTAPLSST